MVPTALCSRRRLPWTAFTAMLMLTTLHLVQPAAATTLPTVAASSLMQLSITVTSACNQSTAIPGIGSLPTALAAITLPNQWTEGFVSTRNSLQRLDVLSSALLTAVTADVLRAVSTSTSDGVFFARPSTLSAIAGSGASSGSAVASVFLTYSCIGATNCSTLSQRALQLVGAAVTSNAFPFNTGSALDYAEAAFARAAGFTTFCNNAPSTRTYALTSSTSFVSVTRSLAVYDRNDGASPMWYAADMVDSTIVAAVADDLALFLSASMSVGSAAPVVILAQQFRYDTAVDFNSPSPTFQNGVPLRVLVALTIYAADTATLSNMLTSLVGQRIQAQSASLAMQAQLATAAATPIDVQVLIDSSESQRNQLLGLNALTPAGQCSSLTCNMLVCLWAIIVPVILLEFVYGASGERADQIRRDEANAEEVLADTDDAKEAATWRHHHGLTTAASGPGRGLPAGGVQEFVPPTALARNVAPPTTVVAAADLNSRRWLFPAGTNGGGFAHPAFRRQPATSDTASVAPTNDGEEADIPVPPAAATTDDAATTANRPTEATAAATGRGDPRESKRFSPAPTGAFAAAAATR